MYLQNLVFPLYKYSVELVAFWNKDNTLDFSHFPIQCNGLELGQLHNIHTWASSRLTSNQTISYDHQIHWLGQGFQRNYGFSSYTEVHRFDNSSPFEQIQNYLYWQVSVTYYNESIVISKLFSFLEGTLRETSLKKYSWFISSCREIVLNLQSILDFYVQFDWLSHIYLVAFTFPFAFICFSVDPRRIIITLLHCLLPPSNEIPKAI